MSLLYKLKNILKTDDHLSPVEKKINYLFHNREYLVQAFTHKSITPSPRRNYERLEFLGDSILSSIVSEFLFIKNKNSEEGELSKNREVVVSRDNLNQIGKHFFVGIDLKFKTKKISENMYGDFLEALVAGIYLEKGADKAREFVIKTIINKKVKKQKLKEDFKGRLIDLTNKENKKVNFVKLAHKGPDHKKTHKIGLEVDGKIIMTNWSPTIKEAEHKLAKAAIEKIYENNTRSR